MNNQENKKDPVNEQGLKKTQERYKNAQIVKEESETILWTKKQLLDNLRSDQKWEPE